MEESPSVKQMAVYKRINDKFKERCRWPANTAISVCSSPRGAKRDGCNATISCNYVPLNNLLWCLSFINFYK